MTFRRPGGRRDAVAPRSVGPRGGAVRLLPTGVALRPAAPGDGPVASRIVSVALGDLYARQGRAAPVQHPHDAVYEHLVADGLSTFWVAEAPEGLVGFAVGLRRSDLCWAPPGRSVASTATSSRATR